MRIWFKLTAYVMPLVVALVWVSMRGYVPIAVVQKIMGLWFGFGLGIYVGPYVRGLF
jgi:hypothetical protein